MPGGRNGQRSVKNILKVHRTNFLENGLHIYICLLRIRLFFGKYVNFESIMTQSINHCAIF